MIVSNIICRGASRFLNTAYFQDVSISGTATLSSLSLSGNLSVTGTSTLSGNTTVGGTLGVTGAATFNNWITTANNYGWKSAYGGGWYMNGPNYIRSYGKPVLMDHNMYFGTAGDTGYYVKTTGAAKFASVVAPTGSIATLNSDNVSVSNNLHATNFDLQTVAQLGGSFYVSPTVKFPNSGTKLAVSKSSTQLTLTIKDSSISTSTMAGIVWTANSAVKVSGTINGVVTGTMDGTIDSITNGSQMVVKVSGGNWNSVSATSTDLTSSQFSDLTVMVYQRHDGSNDYRVGIWMNCYDLVNSSSTIRVYGGTSSTPNVTIGNLTGSTFNGETISGNNNWGILTTMGYFEGAIISTEGQIGGWTIGDTKLYHNTNSITSTDAGLYLGTDGIRNYSSGTQYVNITSGKITALGVDVSGKITATSGAIGGFDITSTAIKTKDVAVTSNADNSISLSSADFTRTINSTSRAGLRFAIGDKFGVTGDGIIYASSVDLTGKITATSGTIGGCSITDGVLYITDANVSGTISASHINTSSITIAQSQVTNLTTDLGNKASSSDLTTLSNKVTAVYGTSNPSSTNASTQAKVVTCSNFELYSGALITVKFTYANTYASGAVQLNVNSKGAKNIWVANAVTSSSNKLLWGAGAVITFRYDGTQFVVVGEPRTWFGASTTAAATAAKTDTTAVTGCVVCKGTIVSLSMTYENTATEPTLNIAGTGAIALYAGNSTTRPLTSNGLGWTAGSTTSFVFDGSVWRVGDTAGLARAYSAQSTANTANTNATNAAKTATNFITADGTNGIKVHNTSNTTDYVQITSDGTHIYKGGNNVATFGETATIGNMSARGVSIDANGFKFNNSGEQNFFIGVNNRSGDTITSATATVTKSSNQTTIDGILYYRAASISSTQTVISVVGHLESAIENGEPIVSNAEFENVKSWVVDGGYLWVEDGFSTYSSFEESITYTYVASNTSNLPYMVLGISAYDNDSIPGIISFAQGYKNKATGSFSTALGASTVASGKGAFACGSGAVASSDWSFACGSNTIASGSMSFACGSNTIASGSMSFACGINTIASANASHAEGWCTEANGLYSHAEGYHTLASGSYSHAEGWCTEAGNTSHSEGVYTSASGYTSHAEGNYTIASGSYSHAQGHWTVVNNSYNTVIGKYNKATVSGSGTQSNPYVYTNVGDYPFIIGNGTANTTAGRSNAFTVDWSGNVVASGSFTGTGATLTGALSGTSATFSSTLSAAGATLTGALSGTSASFTGDVLANKLIGASATLTGALTGTSATFSGNVTANKCIGTQNILWNGANWGGGLYLGSDQYADLSESVTSQANGIILAWSSYNPSTYEVQNYYWNFTFIPKYQIANFGGQGITCTLFGANFAQNATKYVYISDTRVTGHANNTSTGTNNGVTYANNRFVLRYIIGV